MQRSVNDLQYSFDELKPRFEKKLGKVKTDDKINTPKLEIAAGSEEIREAMAIFSAVSSKSGATRDFMTILLLRVVSL